MKKLYPIVLIALALCFTTITSYSQNDIFVKVQGIDGESTDALHPKELKAMSFSQSSLACPSSGSGAGGGCIDSGPFVINAFLDKSVILLRRNLYLGLVLPRIDLTFRKPGADPFEFQRIRMEDVQIIGITEVLNDGDDRNSVQITIKPRKIGWTYRLEGPSGSVTETKFGYDIINNSVWSF